MDELELAEPAGFEAIEGNARRIAPFLRSRSADIDAERRLPPDVVARLIEAGVFRMNMPASWGGPELTSPDQVRVIEQISRGDASAGWCTMIGCDAGIYSGYLDDGVARNLYPHLDVVQAGWVYPVGRAEEVEGGYRVSGQWRFCSGSSHADMIAAGCNVFRDGAPVMTERGVPEWRLMLAPREHWQIDDNWHTTGLRGTASNDYTTVSDHMFVPREHSFSFFEPKREGLLWKRADTLLRKMSGIPLGVARQALDDATHMLSQKTEPLTGRPVRNSTRIKMAIADCEMRLGAARAYVFDTLERQWEHLEADRELPNDLRADLWLSRLNAFQAARDIARTLFDSVGGSAIYAKAGPFDRYLRDTETMCQHIVGQHKSMEDVGGLLLGSDEQSSSPML